MKQIGDILKKRRLEKKVTFDMVRKDTRIPIKYLNALEDVDPSQFPAEVYFIGFLKKYANYLGINPEELVEIYREHLIKSKDEKKGAETKKSYSLKDSHYIALAVFVVSVLILSTIEYWMPFVKSFSMKLVEKSISATSEPLISVSTITTVSNTANVTVSEQPSLAVNTGMKLEVKMISMSWIKVVSDDKLVFEGTLPPNTEKEWFANDKFYLVVGYTPGVNVKFNGKTVDVNESSVKDINQLILTKDSVKSLSRKY